MSNPAPFQLATPQEQLETLTQSARFYYGTLLRQGEEMERLHRQMRETALRLRAIHRDHLNLLRKSQ